MTAVAVHLRRYRPLYVIATAWCLMIAFFPTTLRPVVDSTRRDSAGGATDAPEVSSVTTATDATLTSDTATGAPARKGQAARKTSSAATSAVPVGTVQFASGVTRGGYACAPGVRQVPWSAYAPPCVAKFVGANGGATNNGVTTDTITLVARTTVDQGGPASQESDRVSQQAGGASLSQRFQYANTLLPWFNRNYELYGRKVTLRKFDGQGNGIDEAQGRGQQAACADATAIATTVHAFAGVAYPLTEESGPFADCAARQHLLVPLGAIYYPESYYQNWDPYVWDNRMNCERIARDLAEYGAKRLNHRNAKWAGDPTYQTRPRKFALYVPNDPAYQRCADVATAEFAKRGGVISSRYNYALDVSQFPSEALRATVQFSADHDTTVILACDSISTIFLTQAAKQQGWYPEWVIIGAGGNDFDGSAALFEQSEVDGHLFGMSQKGGTTQQIDPAGEAARAWREATGGQTLPDVDAAEVYFNLVAVFSLLQAGGPLLTPQHVAAGARSLPPAGGSSAVFGTWSWANEHAATIDAREVFWDGGSTRYVETYGGRRFQSGQWPAEEPPIYPGR